MICCRICLCRDDVRDMREEVYQNRTVYSIFIEFCGIEVADDQFAGGCSTCIHFLGQYREMKKMVLSNNVRFLSLISQEDLKDSIEDEETDNVPETEYWVEEYIEDAEVDVKQLDPEIVKEITFEVSDVTHNEVPINEHNHDLQLIHQLGGIVKDWNIACPFCFLEIPKRRDRLKHRQAHIDENGGYQCDLCHYKHVKRIYILSHMLQVHMVDRTIRHQCDICGKTYAQKGQVLQHKRAEHFNERRYCQICSRSFKLMSALTVHIKTVHEKVRKFPCGECDKRFASAHAREVHVTLIHVKDKKFQCSVCPKRFGSLSNKITHEKSHQDKTIQCQMCDYVTNTTFNLKRHMTRHETTLKFSCAFCNKSFKGNDALRIHTKTHKTSRLPCEFCDKKFKEKRTLKIHVNAVHLQKKFECSVCSDVFTTRNAMNVHIKRQHQGIRLVCKCGKYFDRKDRYKKHGDQCELARAYEPEVKSLFQGLY